MDTTINQDQAIPDDAPMGKFQEKSSIADYAESKGAKSSSQKRPLIDHYKMNNGDRGWALIFDNREFTKDQYKERHGTGKDSEVLFSMLSSELGFDEEHIELCHDLSLNEMKKKIIEVAAEDYTDCDCFICMIMSYGTRKGDIYTADGKLIGLAELMEPFKGKQFQASKSLIGKPKIFLIQACPLEIGGALEKGDALEIGGEEKVGNDAIEDVESPKEAEGFLRGAVNIPTEADFFVACSSVPGSLTLEGSWFIQTLEEVVEAKCETDDLLSMLTKVSGKIADKFEDGNNIEVPYIRSTLTKKVFFKKRQ